MKQKEKRQGHICTMQKKKKSAVYTEGENNEATAITSPIKDAMT